MTPQTGRRYRVLADADAVVAFGVRAKLHEFPVPTRASRRGGGTGVQGRRALLTDLAAVARRHAYDEVQAVLTIAVRARVGQAKHVDLDVRHDHRDLRYGAVEELCDVTFYVTADVLDPYKSPRQSRRAEG
jgi:hypothetical protein